MNRRLPDLKPSTAAARRRTRIDSDKQVSTLHNFQERRNREFRRTHEDNSHRAPRPKFKSAKPYLALSSVWRERISFPVWVEATLNRLFVSGGCGRLQNIFAAARSA